MAEKMRVACVCELNTDDCKGKTTRNNIDSRAENRGPERLDRGCEKVFEVTISIGGKQVLTFILTIEMYNM
jgi:hypothetical protein